MLQRSARRRRSDTCPARRRRSSAGLSPPPAELHTPHGHASGSAHAWPAEPSTHLSPPQASSTHLSAHCRRSSARLSPPQAELCAPLSARRRRTSSRLSPPPTGLSTPLPPALSAQEPAAGGAPSAVRLAAGGALCTRARLRRRAARSPAQCHRAGDALRAVARRRRRSRTLSSPARRRRRSPVLAGLRRATPFTELAGPPQTPLDGP